MKKNSLEAGYKIIYVGPKKGKCLKIDVRFLSRTYVNYFLWFVKIYSLRHFLIIFVT